MVVVKLSVIGMSCTSCSGTIERALVNTAGVKTAEISLVMNAASIDIEPSITWSDLVEIIEDLGFEASLLEIEDEETTAKANESIKSNLDSQSLGVPLLNHSSGVLVKEEKMIAKINTRKVMLQVDDKDAASLSANSGSLILEELRRQKGVIDANFTNAKEGKDSINCYFKLTLHESLVGPRVLLSLLELKFQLHATVVSQGGFMMAGRMLKLHDKELKKQRDKLLIASIFTVPILIITMVLPGYPTAKAVIDTPLMKGVGLNVYGLLLLLLCSPVQWIIGWAFHVKALRSMQSGSLGMDFLISSGTIAAYVFSVFGLLQGISRGVAKDEDCEFFETAAVLITVVIFGKYLECYARGVTAAAIHRLSSLRATHARLVTSEEAEMGVEIADEFVGDSTGVLIESKGGGDERFGDTLIDASLLQRDDMLRLVEGESVPADGILMSNSVGIDESMLTGESRLVSKKVGDVMYGGSMVVEGSGLMRVTACGDASALGRIVSSVQAAQGSKPPIQEVADQIARYFVPLIALCSFLTLIVWLIAGWANAIPIWWYVENNPNGNLYLFAFKFSLAVWVSACPCAFGLATPTAILVSTGVAAKLGVLVRRGAALQYAAEVDTIVFDKTGTLTLGKTSVCDFIVTPLNSIVDDIQMENLSLQSISLHNLLQYLLIAESSSSHPLAKGITEYCDSRLKEIEIELDFSKESVNRLSNENSYQTTVVPGQGIKLAVTIDREQDGTFDVLVGSQELLHSHGVAITSQHIDIAAGLRGGGKVAVFMSIGSSLRVIIGVSDPVRPDAASVVATLREKGVRCYMVTGDERATAVAIGKVVGISVTDIFARAKPDDKEQFIKRLQSRGKKVAFIGDGTNDSPALARADVGFALAGGTDIAIEAGDIVLCRNDLSSMITAIDLAGKTMRRIKINYFWALFYNSILVPISAGVLFPSYHFALVPMYAGMAMALSSVCIVLSSLFLLLYTPPVLLGEQISYHNEDHAPLESECRCPASLAPVLQVHKGLIRRIYERILTSLKGKFRPYYYLLSRGDHSKGSVGSFSTDRKGFSPLETQDTDDKEDGGVDMEQGESDLSDVQRFLNSDDVDSFISGDRGEGGDVYIDDGQVSSSYKGSGDSSSLLRRRTTGMTVDKGSRCNCGKGNCRCNSSCRCGGGGS